MSHDHFKIRIDLFKYKRVNNRGCAYKHTGSSHLKQPLNNPPSGNHFGYHGT